MWYVIKTTLLGKLGALLVGGAPIIFAVELSSHVDALIAALPPTAAVIVGVMTLKRGQKALQVNLDGRMTQLLEVTKSASLAEGKETERGEARDRRDEIQHEMKKAKQDAPTEVTVTNTTDNPVNTTDIPPLA